MADATPPVLPLDDLLLDPFGAITRARAEGEVAHSDLATVTLSHAAAQELLTSGAFAPNFVEAIARFGVTSGPFHDWMAMSPLNMDGPAHREWRALMSRTFTPRSADRLRPYLAATSLELIDGFAALSDADGVLDFTAAFADKLPLLALCELIGVPPNDREQFGRWADSIGKGFNPIELAMCADEVDDATVALLGYAAGLVEQRRAEPRDDLVSRIAVVGREEGFPDEQLVGSVAGLVFAGHETTKMQLGWAISVLAEHPDVWDGLAADPSSVAAVVDEVMRTRSAVAAFPRGAVADTEVRGCPVASGDFALVSVWGANHDPAVYPDDTFDPTRPPEPAMTFGFGAHYCLGAGLAKAEVQEALLALTARLHRPELVEGAEWRPPVGINGPTKLPVRFAAR